MYDSMQNTEIIGILTKEFDEVRKEKQLYRQLLYVLYDKDDIFWQNQPGIRLFFTTLSTLLLYPLPCLWHSE